MPAAIGNHIIGPGMNHVPLSSICCVHMSSLLYYSLGDRCPSSTPEVWMREGGRTPWLHCLRSDLLLSFSLALHAIQLFGARSKLYTHYTLYTFRYHTFGVPSPLYLPGIVPNNMWRHSSAYVFLLLFVLYVCVMLLVIGAFLLVLLLFSFSGGMV